MLSPVCNWSKRKGALRNTPYYRPLLSHARIVFFKQMRARRMFNNIIAKLFQAEFGWTNFKSELIR